MKAKKKPLDTLNLADTLGDFSDKEITIEKFESPQPRSKGIMVESVDELVALLKEKGLA